MIPEPLLAMRVPEPLTSVLTWLSVVLSLAGLLWSLRHLARTGEPMALLLGVGGAVASLTEPLYDIAALIWHPVIGQWTAFHLFGRDTPMFIPRGWCWNVGFTSALLWVCFRDGRIRADNLWWWFAGSVAMNMVFEIPGTSLGIYVYHGHQPLALTSGQYPLGIAFGNGAAMLTVAFIAHRLEPLFRRGAPAWAGGWFITPFAFWTGSAPGWIPTMMAMYEREGGYAPRLTLPVADPPVHRRHRALLEKALGAANVQRMKAMVMARIDDIMGAFIDRGYADYTRKFSLRLPVSIQADLLGMSHKHLGIMLQMADSTVKLNDGRALSREEIIDCHRVQIRGQKVFQPWIEHYRREAANNLGPPDFVVRYVPKLAVRNPISVPIRFNRAP